VLVVVGAAVVVCVYVVVGFIIVIFVVQPANVVDVTLVVLWYVMEVNPEQLLNAPDPIIVTVDGMTKSPVSPEHCQND